MDRVRRRWRVGDAMTPEEACAIVDGLRPSGHINVDKLIEVARTLRQALAEAQQEARDMSSAAEARGAERMRERAAQVAGCGGADGCSFWSYESPAKCYFGQRCAKPIGDAIRALPLKEPT